MPKNASDHALFASLARRKEGIKHEDAIQIFLWLYCTLSVLPNDFPVDEISTATLVEIFTELSRQGLIHEPADTSPEVEWADLPREFLSGRFSLDDGFPGRIEDFLAL